MRSTQTDGLLLSPPRHWRCSSSTGVVAALGTSPPPMGLAATTMWARTCSTAAAVRSMPSPRPSTSQHHLGHMKHVVAAVVERRNIRCTTVVSWKHVVAAAVERHSIVLSWKHATPRPSSVAASSCHGSLSSPRPSSVAAPSCGGSKWATSNAARRSCSGGLAASLPVVLTPTASQQVARSSAVRRTNSGDLVAAAQNITRRPRGSGRLLEAPQPQQHRRPTIAHNDALVQRREMMEGR